MNQLSKAALLDLVADMIYAEIGEFADDEAFIATFLEKFGPVARLRGDKIPKR